MERKSFKLAIAIMVVFAAGCDQCDRSVGTNKDAGVQNDAAPTPEASLPDAALPHEIEYQTSYPSTADLTVGDTDVSLIKVRMKNLSQETAMIDMVPFMMWYHPWWDIYNPTLYVSGLPLNTDIDNFPSGSLDLHMDLIADYAIEPGETATFELRGDIWQDAACGNLDIRFNDEYARALGAVTDFPYLFVPHPDTTQVIYRDVFGGVFKLSYDPNEIDEAWIPAGSQNVPVLQFTFQAGTTATVGSYELEIYYVANTWEYIDQLRILKKIDNQWIAIGSGYVNQANCTAAICTVEIPDAVSLPNVCEVQEFLVTTDIPQNAPSGTMHVSLHGESIQAYDTNQNPLPEITSSAVAEAQHIVGTSP